MRNSGYIWVFLLVTIAAVPVKSQVRDVIMVDETRDKGKLKTWCLHENKHLQWIYNGKDLESSHSTLSHAIRYCISAGNDCHGVTYDPDTTMYTLRRGSELKYRNGRRTWLLCKSEDIELLKITSGNWEIETKFPDEPYWGKIERTFSSELLDGYYNKGEEISYSPYSIRTSFNVRMSFNLEKSYDIYLIKLHGSEISTHTNQEFKLSDWFNAAKIGNQSDQSLCHMNKEYSTTSYQCAPDFKPFHGNTVSFEYKRAENDLKHISFRLYNILIYGKLKKSLSDQDIALIVVGVVVFVVILFIFGRSKRGKRLVEVVLKRGRVRESEDVVERRRERAQRSPDQDPETTAERALRERIERIRMEEARERAENYDNVRHFTRTQIAEQPNLRITTERRENPGSITVETHPSIPLQSEISNLSPPSYQESIMREENGSREKVPSYDEVMAQSNAFVMSNPAGEHRR